MIWPLSIPLAIFGIHDPQWNAVAVAAITAIATTLLTTFIKERARLGTETLLHRRKADANYEYEQRKKLRDKIGEYRGQLVEAATDFNYRLANLDTNVQEGWLNKDGMYRQGLGGDYYFRTTVYRFAVLTSVANRFERDALHIDERIAEPTDMSFLLYVKAFRWVVTDAALFRGLDYDATEPTDHFYTDRLREMCVAMYAESGELRFSEFEDKIPSHTFGDALRFFDGLAPGTLRWDRIIAFRLLLLAFINTFGYEMQRSDVAHFDQVAKGIEHPEIATNLIDWIAKLGLESDAEAGKVRAALSRRLNQPVHS